MALDSMFRSGVLASTPCREQRHHIVHEYQICFYLNAAGEPIDVTTMSNEMFVAILQEIVKGSVA
jgi:hypothetical protein